MAGGGGGGGGGGLYDFERVVILKLFAEIWYKSFDCVGFHI